MTESIDKCALRRHDTKAYEKAGDIEELFNMVQRRLSGRKVRRKRTRLGIIQKGGKT